MLAATAGEARPIVPASTAHDDFRRAVALVAALDNVTPTAIFQPQGRDMRRRLWIASYLAHVTTGQPIKGPRGIATAARFSSRRVRDMIQRVEEMREDPDIDRRVAELEEALLCAA